MTVVVDLFRVLSACTSTAMLLSPIPMIWSVWKTKHTGVASIVPLVTMYANSHNNAIYGYLTEHYFPIFYTFIFGDVLCIAYITIFYWYSPETRKAHRVFLLFGVPLALLTIYEILGGFGVAGLTRHETGNVAGYVAVLTNVLLYSAPFEKAALVLKHRSAVFLNIHMVCAGTINNAVWIVYTSLTKQWAFCAAMVVCCTGGCIQIVLYVLFHPSTHPYDGPMPGQLPTTAMLRVESARAGTPKFQVKKTEVVTTQPESPDFVAIESLQIRSLS